MPMNIKSFTDRKQSIEDLQKYIDSNFNFANAYHILEAGCGSMSKVAFPGEFKITGVDISEKQLERNEHLSEKICADIQLYDLGVNQYDVVICWEVLEHLQSPEQAMKLFRKATRNGGLVILALPNVLSLKGLFTKYTPHSVHVLYYRWILSRPNAGKNDTAPFETFLRWTVTPGKIEKKAFKNFSMEYFSTYDGQVSSLKKSHWYLYRVYQVTAYTLKILSLGKLGGMKNSDFIMILRKPG